MGFQLTIAEGKEAGRQFDFDQASVVIGRTHECDVTLYEGGISRRHARIFQDGETWLLVDEGSSNGTLVNGAKVARHVLAEGDRITVGPVVFVWRPVDLAPTTENPAPDQSAFETRLLSASELTSRNRAMAMVPEGASPDELVALGRRGTHLELPALVVATQPVAIDPSLMASPVEPARLTAAERAWYLRRGPWGRAALFWKEASPRMRALWWGGGGVGLAGLLGLVWSAAFGLGPPSRPEPVELGAEPIEASFGVGPDVDFVRVHEKAFEFVVRSPVAVMAVLHFQSQDIDSDDELTVSVNGTEVGTAPVDSTHVEERTNELVLPATLVKRGQVNTVVFDHPHDRPGQERWRVWNVWVEFAALPERDPEVLAADAEALFQKGLQRWQQRNIGAANLWEAYRAFREAWLMLEAVSGPRPSTYQRSRDRMRQSWAELDDKCRTLLLEARTAFNLKQYDQTRFALDHVKAFFPSRAHPCPARAEAERAQMEAEE